jgi:HK97 family phage major capsid protein
MDKDKITEMVDEIRSIKDDMEKRMASYNASINTRDTEVSNEWRDIATAMKEKRAVTLSGTGRVNLVPSIVKIAQEKLPLLDKVSYYYGRDAQTNIPVWNPTIAEPVAYNEGATNVGSDTTGALGITSITPYAYSTILPVSDATLLMSGSNFEQELPNIFADAFARAIHKGIVSGDGQGKNMTGIFADANVSSIECAETGAPTMKDLVSLALKLQSYYNDAVIVLNPAIYASITATANDDITRVYKEILIRDRKIEGVSVILTEFAPSATTAGSVCAVGGNLKNYCVGMAQELVVEPFRSADSLNTLYRGVAYFNGKPALSKNFWALKTV